MKLEKLEIHTTVTFVYAEETCEKAKTNAVVEVANPILSNLLWTLEFTVRTYNCLKGEDIITVGDLVKKTARELRRIYGLGSKSLKEIETALEKEGLHLAVYPACGDSAYENR